MLKYIKIIPAKIKKYKEIKTIIIKYTAYKSTASFFFIFCSSRLISNFPYSYFVMSFLTHSKTAASYAYEDSYYFSCNFC